jgi:hypothetical protein
VRGVLKGLAAIGIAGCVVYGVAQSIATKADQGGQGRPGAGALRANQAGKPSSYVKPNVVQELLRYCIITEGNALGDKAKAEGRPSVLTKIVETYCYHTLTTMRPDEQQHEIHDVWQIGVWKKDGSWDHIAAAPSLAKEILNVDAVTAKKVNALWEKSVDQVMGPYIELSKRLWEQAGHDRAKYDALYKVEHAKLRASMVKNAAGKPSSPNVMKSLVDEAKAVMPKAMAMEFEQFYLNCRRDMIAVAAGATPSFITKK